MARYGIVLDNQPLLKISSTVDLVAAWTKHRSAKRPKVIWNPTKNLALDARAVIGVRRLARQPRQTKVRGFAG